MSCARKEPAVASRKISVFVDRFEGDCAVLLVGEGGAQVRWPIEYLPDGVVEGGIVSFTLNTDTAATKAAGDVINSLIEHLEHGE